jgi:Relaxase/Mobilisation nuclease domain
MKLRPPSSPVVQMVPALLAKRGKGGTSFRGADRYVHGKPGAVLLATNLEGLTPRERAREISHLRAASKLKRAVDAWSISLDPRLGKLTDDQWRQVGQDFIDQMGYAGCAYTLTRHVDEPQDHIHLTLLRIRSDGSVVSDSNDFKRSHEAAARCAAAIGLHPLPPRPEASWAPAPTDAQVGANKRATRRGTAVQNHASIARTFDHIVSKSVDLAELESKLLEVDVELQIVRKSGSQVQGLNVRATGADEWMKASNLKSDRSLSWTKVAARLASNLDLRERANAQAEQVAAAARERAEQRVAVRLDQQSEPVSQPARAMLPEVANQAKEATMDDTLDFLNLPPLPRPDGVPLDDVGLTPFTPLASAEAADAEERHKKKLKTDSEDLDRNQAMLEMQTEVRKLSVKELLDLKSNVPPFVLTAAMIERLISLMIRLLTLGLVKRVDNLSDALAARQQLQQLAEAELDRRRRLPATVADRKEALREYGAAVEWRSKALNERRTLRSMPDPRADEHRARRATELRQRMEDAFDQKRAAASLETIKTRRAAHDDARAEHRRVRAENEKVPGGFAGLLITRVQRDAAAAAKVAAALLLKNAAERRETAREQLQLLIDEVEQAVVAHEQEASEQAAAAEKAEAFERDALARELRALPEQLREIGAAAQRERVGQRAAELVADASRPKSPVEIEAAEAERLRQLDMVNRRG